MKLQMNPYILVDGSAQEAIAFYQEALGAVVLFKQTMGEGPQNPDAPMTEQEKAQIAHAVLLAGETKFLWRIMSRVCRAAGATASTFVSRWRPRLKHSSYSTH